jgi:hypothetical protein
MMQANTMADLVECCLAGSLILAPLALGGARP